VNSFQRMTVPGTAVVHVAQPATRVLYYESTGGGLLWDAAPRIVGIIAAFLVGTGVGLALIIITAVRRSSARQLAVAP
jgi:hypothetical protein